MALTRRARWLLGVFGALVALGAIAVAALEHHRKHHHGGAPGFWTLLVSGGTGVLTPPGPVRLVRVATGFEQITDVAFIPTAPPRVVVLSRTGTVKVAPFDRDRAERSPVDGRKLSSWVQVDVDTSFEMGLLGIALHPRFRDEGRFFLHANPAGPRASSRVTEWHVDPANLDRDRPRLVRTVLELDQPYREHKGGQLAFGPDGMLYIGLGDGCDHGDPHGNGQNLGTWLGKVLRIDVERADDAHPYAVPADNPLVGRAGARPEIWVWGARNPWRFSFDSRGRLVIADVGEFDWEEVDLAPRGANLGWNRREGRHCFAADVCDGQGTLDPVWEYPHGGGAAVIGGYEYTGRRAPALVGRWLVADFTGKLDALALPDAPGEAAGVTDLGRADLLVTTFGRAPDGEVYVADFSSGGIFGFASDGPGAR